MAKNNKLSKRQEKSLEKLRKKQSEKNAKMDKKRKKNNVPSNSSQQPPFYSNRPVNQGYYQNPNNNYYNQPNNQPSQANNAYYNQSNDTYYNQQNDGYDYSYDDYDYDNNYDESYEYEEYDNNYSEEYDYNEYDQNDAYANNYDEYPSSTGDDSEYYHLNPRTSSSIREALDIMGLYWINENEYTMYGKEIRDAYKIMAKRYHPDLNKTENAMEQFLWIKKAYEKIA